MRFWKLRAWLAVKLIHAGAWLIGYDYTFTWDEDPRGTPGDGELVVLWRRDVA